MENVDEVIESLDRVKTFINDSEKIRDTKKYEIIKEIQELEVLILKEEGIL